MSNDIWKKFQENPITHSGAHHLLAIYNLVNERGYARVTDIAKRLSITTGSVSTNLKVLKQRGLVEVDENKMLKTSEEGSFLAKAILSRRAIFSKFLIDILHVEEAQAEIDACKVEHLLSQETSQRLLQFMKEYLAGTSKSHVHISKVSKNESQCPHESEDDCSVCSIDCLGESC